jgi:hypothetical protein
VDDVGIGARTKRRSYGLHSVRAFAVAKQLPSIATALT